MLLGETAKRNRRILLFNDMLLIVRTDWRDKYHLIEKASFRQCGVSDIQDEPDVQSANMFEIEVGEQDGEYDENSRYIFACPTKIAKANWIESYINVSQLAVKTKKLSMLTQSVARGSNSDDDEEDRPRQRSSSFSPRKVPKSEKALVAEIKDLKDRLAKAMEDEENYKTSITQKSDATENMMARVQQLQAERVKAKEDTRQERDLANRKIQTLENDLSSVKAELTALQEKSRLDREEKLKMDNLFSSIKVELEEAVSDCEKISGSSLSNQVELEKLKAENSDSESERHKMMGSMNILNTTLSNCQRQLREKDICIKNLEQEKLSAILKHKEEIERLESESSRFKALYHEVCQSEKNAIAALESSKKTLEVENAELLKTIASQNERIKETELKNLHLQKENVSQSKKMSEIKLQSDSLQRLQLQIEEQKSYNEALLVKMSSMEKSTFNELQLKTNEYAEKMRSVEVNLVTAKSEIHSRDTELDSLRRVNEDLRQNLHSMQDERKAHQVQLEAKANLISSLQIENTRVSKELEYVVSAQKEVNLKINSLSEELRDKNSHVSKLDSELARVNGQLDSVTALKAFFESNLAEKNNILREKEKALSDVSEKLALSSSNCAHQSEEVGHYRRKLEEVQDKITEAGKTRKHLEARVKQLESGADSTGLPINFKEISALEAKLKEKIEYLNAKDRELSEIKTAHMRREYEDGLKIQSLNQEVKQLESQLQAQNLKMSYMEEKIQDRARESEVVRKERFDTIKNQENLIKMIETSKRKSSVFEESALGREHENSRLQARLAEKEDLSNKRLIEIESLKTQQAASVEKYQISIQNLNCKLDQADQERKELEGRYNSLKLETEGIRRDKQEFLLKINKTESDVAKLTQEISFKTAEVARLLQEIDTRKKREEDLSKSKKSLKESLRIAEESLQSKDAQVNANTTAQKEFLSSIKALESQLISKEKEIYELESRIKSFEESGGTMRVENDSLRASIKSKEAQSTELISSLRDNLRKSEEEKAELKNTVKEKSKQADDFAFAYDSHIAELEQGFSYERENFAMELSNLKEQLTKAAEKALSSESRQSNELEMSNSELESSRARIKMLEEDIVKLKKSLESMEEVKVKKQRELCEIKEGHARQLADMQEKCQNMSQELVARSNDHQTLTEKTQTISKLTDEVARIKRVLESTKKEFADQIKQKDDEIESTKAKIVKDMTLNFSQSAQSLEKLYAKIEDLNQKLNDKEKIIEKSASEIATMKGQKQRYTKFLSNAMEESEKKLNSKQESVNQVTKKLQQETKARQIAEQKTSRIKLICLTFCRNRDCSR